jgi:predicted aspartyl protease
MKTLNFQSEHRYDGDKVLASVRLLGARIPTRVEMVLDTGAEISLLNRDFISHLRLSIQEGEPIELMVANKAVTRAYIHSIDVEFLGRRLTIPAAICPDWDTQNLLGMRGFFDQMVVAFDHANWTIHF